MKEKPVIGYTTGVFDLFHIGHLNILRQAKSLCDYLIVGVTTDEVCLIMKGHLPAVPFEERISIVESIKYVDKAIAKSNTNNKKAWKELQFDIMIKGDDWKGTKKGKKLEKELAEVGVSVVYFPYTQETSSSNLTLALSKLNKQNT